MLGRQGKMLNLLDPKTQGKAKEVLRDPTEWGRYDFIIACDLMNEGTDWPKASVLHVLRTVNSLRLSYQLIGRLFRPYEGKTSVAAIFYLDREPEDKLRSVCSDRVNGILLSLFMSAKMIPIRVPDLPSLRAHVGASLDEVMGDELFTEFSAQVSSCIAECKRSGTKEQLGLALNMLCTEFQGEHPELDLGVLRACVKSVAGRVASVTRGEVKDVLEFDVSVLRLEDSLDLVWEKFDEAMFYGTRSPISDSEFSAFKKILHRRGLLDEEQDLEGVSALMGLSAPVVEPLASGAIPEYSLGAGQWVEVSGVGIVRVTGVGEGGEFRAQVYPGRVIHRWGALLIQDRRWYCWCPVDNKFRGRVRSIFDDSSVREGVFQRASITRWVGSPVFLWDRPRPDGGSWLYLKDVAISTLIRGA